MDDASADLILALQVQDLADLDDLATDHGGEEAAGDTSSDAHLARKLYREELRNNAAIISDLRFGEKVSEAAGDEPPSPCASATPTFDQVLVNSVGLLTIEASPTTEDKTSSFNHWGTGNYDCVICADEFPARHLITAPCGDYYCKNCTGRLYDLAMKDESLFPPRCCGKPIPLGIATPVLTAAQVQKFHEKRIEYNTQNRTYCHDTTCGAFVAPEKISGEKAMCTCGTMTCTVCKSAAHEDDCPKDPAYTSFVALAAAKGYQKCQQCKRLVELSLGCNHMTCLCGAEFCYVCGATWKQCLCPQYDEDRLMARAGVIVDRAPAPQVGVPVVRRDELIQQAAEDLQDNHACNHEGYRAWQKTTRGDLTCEHCLQTLPHLLYECRQCRLRACFTCSRNRL